MTQNLRKWLSLIISIVIYYIFHEGAHLALALAYGTFERIRIAKWGLGIQIVADTAAMTNAQIFVFCIAGVVATLIVSYILVWKVKAIGRIGNKLLKAVFYYTTLVFLLLDPIYLSIIHNFVGGGDMNGIAAMGLSTATASFIFAVITIINLMIFVKTVYPKYKMSFSAD